MSTEKKLIHPLATFAIYAANACFVCWLAGYDFNRRGYDVACAYGVGVLIAAFLAFVINRRGRRWFVENFFSADC